MRARPALLVLLLVACATPGGPPAATSSAPAGAESRDMRLVGHEPLQGRSAYQPTLHRHGARVIAYVGHHGGSAVNSLTGREEPNGTSIVDVTDPRAPRYLAHVPGAPGGAEGGGAQMTRVCDGKDGKAYLLRTFGNEAHELWDVTDPVRPSLVRKLVTGLNGTHKNWWECESGIAYLVSDGRPQGWRTNRMTKIMDLSDPARPRLIRDFGLAGQEPGARGEAPEGVHGPIARGNRVYFAYGTSRKGILQIVDRERLLRGDPRAAEPFAPTPANLTYPQIGRLDMAPAWGGHTALPILRVPIADYAPNTEGRVRDFVLVVSEAIANECRELRQMAFFVDVTTEARPFSVSTFDVPESSGHFCSRGGRFGSHSSNEASTPIYDGRLVFIAWFNAGVRAVDVRDPFHPREAGYYIPAVTDQTDRRCVKVDGAERCKIAIQTNNVEVDDRGYVYLADRANTGLHIVEPTGAARAIARFPH